MARKGMGYGTGRGYKNIAGSDPKIHSQSAKGISQPQRVAIILAKKEQKLRITPPLRNKTFNQLKKEGVYLTYKGDKDKDGVKNVKDCRPLNKNKQDDETNLQPRFENVGSFYGKAKVKESPDRKTLQSYSTDVAYIDKKTGKAVVKGSYSQTTMRHIKEFLKQNGFFADNQKQILADYKEEA